MASDSIVLWAARWPGKGIRGWQGRQRLLAGTANRKGLSLLELILALGLSALVLYAISMAVDLHLRALDVRRTNVEEAQVARSVLQMIATDLRGTVPHYRLDMSAIEEMAMNVLSSSAGSAIGGDGAAAGGSTGGAGGTSGGGGTAGGSGSAAAPTGGSGGSGSGASGARTTASPAGGAGSSGAPGARDSSGLNTGSRGAAGGSSTGSSGSGRSATASGGLSGTGASRGGASAGSSATAASSSSGSGSSATTGAGNSSNASSNSTTGGNSTPDQATSSDGSTPFNTDLVNAQSASPVIGLYGNQYQLQIDVSHLPRPDQYLMVNDVADSALPAISSDVKSITYFVQTPELTSSQVPDVFAGPAAAGSSAVGLVRREIDRAVFQYAADNGVVDRISRSGELLAPEVVGIQFQYFDGTTWLSYWDSQQMGGLPIAVEIVVLVQPRPSTTSFSILGLGSSPATVAEPIAYRLVVHLPLSEALASGVQEQQQGLQNLGL